MGNIFMRCNQDKDYYNINDISIHIISKKLFQRAIKIGHNLSCFLEIKSMSYDSALLTRNCHPYQLAESYLD